MTGSHEMYKVFTPFKNAFIKRLKEGLPECVTAPSVRGNDNGSAGDQAELSPAVVR